jgi:hypothetical protein
VLASSHRFSVTDFYFGGEGTDQSREGDSILPIF